MPLFGRKAQKLREKDVLFRKKIDEANRMITNLDMKIAEFTRKYQTLQMRGRQAQSVSELEWMLRQMHIEAERAQALVRECEIEHEDCVRIVEDLTDMFEKSLDEIQE